MTSASPAESATPVAPTGPGPSRRTVDAPTRAFHALFALSFAGAYLTGDSEHWRLVHVCLGYTLVGLLAFRVVWGLVGPRPVRWTSWAGKLRALPAVLPDLRQGRVTGAPLQNMAMVLTVVGLLVGMALTTASGWITYEELAGEWMEEVHEAAGNAVLLLVMGHLALVIGMSLLRGRNLALPMLTGRVPGRGPDVVPHNRRWLAVLMLAAVLGFWVDQFQRAPTVQDGVGLTEGGFTGFFQSLKHRDDDDDHDD